MPVSLTNSIADPDRSDPPSEVRSIDMLRYTDCNRVALSALLAVYGLVIEEIALEQDIPGSFWGGDEAGLIGDRVVVRPDTPVHSILHESCHYICMDSQRRAGLHTNAGGDYSEENAVCYLQITLAGALPEMGMAGMWRDMDRWGYTFRLGSARAWYEQDASDALEWLTARGILAADGGHTGTLRMGI